MKRFVPRLTFANVISCLALFVALGGVGYAATQLPKNSVGTKQLKKGAVTQDKISASTQKTLAGQTGPIGPVGPAGPKGEPGAPGAALGYAHFVNGSLDAARSKGVIQVTSGVTESAEPISAQYCFKLAFTPSAISVTPQAKSFSSEHQAEFTAGAIPAFGPGPSYSGCPAGFRDAEVEAYAPGSNSTIAFWVVFY